MTTCPACKYTRKPTDTAPAYRCPRCGQNYPDEGSQETLRETREKVDPRHEPTSTSNPSPVRQSGREKSADEKFCADCGEIIKVKAEICPKCGVRQARPPEPVGKKQKFVAGILALFLGGLGIHKFYLDQGIQGLIYLVFCWTFIPAFLGLLEGLNYLTMSQRVFDDRYNSGR